MAASPPAASSSPCCPGLSWRGKVDRAVFVGATNAGTHFADETRWADLADLYTNLVAANARAIAALPGGAPIAALVVGAVRGIGVLVRWLASFATDPDSVPGIAAMVPDGPFVTDLNADQRGQPRSGTPWFVVSSDFEVTVDDHPPEMPVAVVTRLVDGVVDHVFTGPNDLVVDVDSMSAIDLPHGGGYVRDELALPPNSVVYHTNYFSQPVVAEALEAWLVRRVDHLEGQEQAAPVPDTDSETRERGVARSLPGPVADTAATDGRATADVRRRATADVAEPPPDDSFAEPPPTTGAEPERGHVRRTSSRSQARDRAQAGPGVDPGDVRRGAAPEPAGGRLDDVAGSRLADRPGCRRRHRVGADGSGGAAGHPGRRPGHPEQERRARRSGPGPPAAASGRRLVRAAVRPARRGGRAGPAQGPGASGARAARQRHAGGRRRRPERRDRRRSGADPGAGRGRVGVVSGAGRRRVAGDRPGGGGRRHAVPLRAAAAGER